MHDIVHDFKRKNEDVLKAPLGHRASCNYCKKSFLWYVRKVIVTHEKQLKFLADKLLPPTITTSVSLLLHLGDTEAVEGDFS